jgi:hypothetical protein
LKDRDVFAWRSVRINHFASPLHTDKEMKKKERGYTGEVDRYDDI